MNLNFNMKENEVLKEEKFKELKIRQQICESSPELRDLKVKLHSAYVAKEIAAQISEKRAQAHQEKLEHRRLMDMMEEIEMISKDQEARKKQEAYEKMLRYREELQNQIIQSNKSEEKYQELIKEKAHIDQIVRSIHEEDEREKEMRMKHIEQMKCEIEEFRKMQQAWSLMEKEALGEEDRRIESYLAQRDQEERAKLEELKKKEAVKKQIQERTEAAFRFYHMQLDEKRERQEVLHDLHTEELRDQDLKKIEEELESALRKRELLKSSYMQHLEDRKKQLMEEEANENIYKQQMLARFAEEARLEQLTAEKRRLKNLEHRRQVQQLLEEKQKQRADEWEQLKAAEKRIQLEKQQRTKIIEEERIRILKKHATKLLGFLPKDTVSQDDLTHLGSEFLEQFNKLKAK